MPRHDEHPRRLRSHYFTSTGRQQYNAETARVTEQSILHRTLFSTNTKYFREQYSVVHSQYIRLAEEFGRCNISAPRSRRRNHDRQLEGNKSPSGRKQSTRMVDIECYIGDAASASNNLQIVARSLFLDTVRASDGGFFRAG